MKLSKIILTITLAAALVSGCSQKKKQTSAPLTKSAVVQKIKKPVKSGQVIQSLRLSTDTSTQLVVANIYFGGNPLVFHINNETNSNQKKQHSEEWVNMNNVYLNGSSKWYKTNLQGLTGHSYAELVDVATNNQFIVNPDKSLIKAYKMKRNKNTYTLTAKITNQKLIKQAADPIFNTVAQGIAQEKVFHNMQKYGKYQSLTIKAVVKNKKLTMYNLFVNMKLGKLMTIKLGQSYGNFGSNDFLKVPANALAASPLPQNNKAKSSK